MFDGLAVLVKNATTVPGGGIVTALTDAGADHRSAETACAALTDVDTRPTLAVDGGHFLNL